MKWESKENKMPKGFWIVRGDVFNSEEYSKYIKQASKIINKFKGVKSLTFQVYHEKEKVNLPLVSRKYKIDVSKELLNKLDSVDLPYLIN